jgi:PBP1b-binding outer membrane lipoprotein LpoB
MKKLTLIILILITAITLTGCSVSSSGRRGGQNVERIKVTTCGSATTVGPNSCNASVWKLGGGN